MKEGASKGVEVVLLGLDGSNPLAFLAALGTFRTLTTAWPHCIVRMTWKVESGAWRPRVTAEGLVGDDAGDRLLDSLAKELSKRAESAAFRFARDLKLMPSAFREFALTVREA